MTDNQPRYTTKRLHQEISRAKDIARMEALAEAAKIVDDAAAAFEKKASTNENAVAHDGLLMASDALELTGDAIRALAISAAPIADTEAEIASFVQSVNEWDDRTSPDDYPDHLLITSEELTLILRNFAATLKGSANG